VPPYENNITGFPLVRFLPVDFLRRTSTINDIGTGFTIIVVDRFTIADITSAFPTPEA
jgi:hypothetical protein